MVTIQDPGAVLSAEARSDLLTRGGSYGLQVIVRLDSTEPNRNALKAVASSLVTTSSELVIAIDPAHHFTYVKGSADLGLPTDASLAAAGNPFFREHDWAGGVDAIVTRSLAIRNAPRTQTLSSPGVIQQQASPASSSAAMWWMMGGLVVLVAAVTAYVLWRLRRTREALELETEELRSRNIEESSWHERFRQRIAGSPPPMRPRVDAPAYVAPVGPSPVILRDRSDGLSELMAFELGEMSGRQTRPIVERETVIVEQGSSSSWGDGGSSSSWGESSSSSDGGSSSSWGGSDDSSSSSSDWGGGSDSSGGSGSEW